MSARKTERQNKKVNKRKGYTTAKVFGMVVILLVAAFACFTIHPALADDSNQAQAAAADQTDSGTSNSSDTTTNDKETSTTSGQDDVEATATDTKTDSTTSNTKTDEAVATTSDAKSDDSSATTTDTKIAPAFLDILKSDPSVPSVNIDMSARITNYDMRAGLIGYSLVIGDAADTDGSNVLGTASVTGDGAITINTDKLTAKYIESLINSDDATYKSEDDGYVVTIPCKVIQNGTMLSGSGITSETAGGALPVDITVTFPKDGSVTVSESYPQGGTFEYSYSTNDAYLNMYGAKLFVVNGATVTVPADVNGKFTFKLTASDGAPLPKKYGTDATCTSTTNEVGNSETYNPIDFGQITFTDADLANVARSADGSKSITYTYTVTEEPNSDTSYMPFTSTETIKVTVTDNGSGRLIVTAENESEGTSFATMNSKNTLLGDTDIVVPGSSSTGGLFQFTNMYSEGTVTATIKATKVLEGRDLKAGEFKFKLVSNGTVIQTVTNAADGSIEFSPITYSEPGTTTYTIEEVKGTETGVNYSSDTITATVDVVENKDTGKMTATVTYAPEDATITNSYGAKPVEANFAVTKTLTGKDLAEGEFSFELIDPSGKVVETVTNAADGSVAFDPVDIDKAGTYTYTIKEVKGDESGTTYDDSAITATFTVTKNNSTGELSIGTIFYSPSASFANTHTDKPVEANFSVTKTLTGKDLAEGEFSFELIDPSGAVVQTVTNAADGSVAFDPVDIDKAGTYTYTIEEVRGDEEGVTYDSTPIKAAFTVTANKATGELTIGTISYSPNAVFVNTFKAGTVHADIAATKVLTGKTLEAGEFSFQLIGPDGAVDQTVTNNADGTIDFAAISFDKAGTYTYTIKEVKGDETGVTYDDSTITATVVVKQNATTGELETPVVTYSSTNPTFTNTFESSAVFSDAATVNADKTLDGAAMVAGQFKFELTPDDAASAALLDTTTFQNNNGVAGKAVPITTATGETLSQVLGAIKFTSADAGNTYSWTLKEVSTAKSGYTTDSSVHTISVKVSTNASGATILDVTVDGNAAGTTGSAQSTTVSFTNTYTAATENAVVIKASKSLTGETLKDGQFRFTLTDATGDIVSDTTNTAYGTIEFTPISYTWEQCLKAIADGDAVATTVNDENAAKFTYTVAEDTEHLETGYSATRKSFSVTVTVVNNGDGTLSTVVTYPENTTISNVYSTSDAYVYITGRKVVTTAESGLVAPDVTGKYTFTIKGVDGAPMPENATATNDASGTVEFGPIEYTLDGLDDQETRTYTYYITESGQVPGVSNDTTTHKVEVTVENKGNGKLTAIITSDEGEFDEGVPDFTFTNVYSVTPVQSSNRSTRNWQTLGGTSVAVGLAKQLEGRDMKAGEFTFELVDPAGKVVSTGTNAADGIISMSEVTFDQPGTFVFTLHEVKGNLPGVTYDTKTYTCTAVVTDNGNGTLAVAWTIAGASYGSDLVFHNTYKASDATATIQATKSLTGRALAANEFTFQLLDSDGNVVSTAKNTASGNIVFDELTFDKAGTYTYTIKEVKGDESGVDYDSAEFTATITVTDDTATGKLVASEPVYSATPKFTNTFTASAIQATLHVNKVLTGETLAAGQFSFQLTDPLGRVVQTVTNAADGDVTFQPVSLTKAGTYVYTITEVNEGAKGVTYDATKITATITVVADDETGELSVKSVEYSPKAVFENEYAEEKVVEKKDETTEKTTETGTKTVEKKTTVDTTSEDLKKTEGKKSATTRTGKASAARKATSVKTTTKTTTTPKTGDATLIAPMAETAAAGAALVAGAAITRRKHRK